jgi:flavin-dependent thymidylate synthase
MLAKPSENSDEDHGTPFEKSYIDFLIRVDTVTHYQILKHRIAVSANTESARYKELLGETCHVPADWPPALQTKLESRFKMAVKDYKAAIAELEPLLGRKRAKESARFFLPLANELTMDVSFNFRSFVHFQRLRNHDTAQREIAVLAATMLQQVHETGDFKHSLAAYGL